MNIVEKALKEGRNTLSEHESKRLLEAYDIPVTRETEITDQQGLKEAVQKIGLPLVLKACGPNLSHKTEIGLVYVDVRNEQEAIEAFEEIMSAVKKDGGSVLVQEMVKGQRELVIGLTRDPQFGPCVMFGLGGIFVEVMKDVEFRLTPLSKEDALKLILSIKGLPILLGARGREGADLDSLVDILLRISKFAVDFPEIEEMDLNPIFSFGPGKGSKVVDVRIKLGGKIMASTKADS